MPPKKNAAASKASFVDQEEVPSDAESEQEGNDEVGSGNDEEEVRGKKDPRKRGRSSSKAEPDKEEQEEQEEQEDKITSPVKPAKQQKVQPENEGLPSAPAVLTVAGKAGVVADIFQSDVAEISDGGRKMVLNVRSDKCGVIIGPRGETIRNVQDRTGCKVDLNQNFPPGEPRKLAIAGEPSAVQQAAELLRAILRDGTQAIHPNALAGGPQVTDYMECEHQFVGRIIGASGANIKDIQGRTGAKVQVLQEGVAEGVPRRVEVTGTQAAVKDAIALINWVIENGPHLPPLQPGQFGYAAQAQGSRGGVLSFIHSGGMPGVIVGPAQGGGTVSIILDCPKDLCGKVIGRGGETIKMMERSSGARIQVDQSVPMGTPCKVTISGAEQAVGSALKQVQDNMNNVGYGGGPPVGYGAPMGGGYGAPMGGGYGMGGNGGGMHPAPQQHMGYGGPGQGYGGGMYGQRGGGGGYGVPQGHYGGGGGGFGGAPQGGYGAPHGGYGGPGPGQGQGGYGQQQQLNRQTNLAPQAYNAPSAYNAPGAAQASGSGLPPGWASHFDASTQATYYHNKATGVTQWQKPV